MGLILDSSILIAGERGGESVREILQRVRAAQGETEAALSAVSVAGKIEGEQAASEALPQSCPIILSPTT